MLRNIFCWKGFGPVTGSPSFPGANFQQMVIARLSLGLSFLGLRNFLKLCHDEKPCTWWLGEKGLGSLQSRLARMLHHEYDALKGYRFLGGGHIVLQRFVHVRCHFQPLPTKLVFAYFDRGSYIYIYKKANMNIRYINNMYICIYIYTPASAHIYLSCTIKFIYIYNISYVGSDLARLQSLKIKVCKSQVALSQMETVFRPSRL